MSKNFYVSNKELYAAMCKYKEAVNLADEQGKTRPRVPEFIGKCIMLIGERLSTKPNFRKYSYTEEMVGDGNLACIRYINNFKPERSNNPFAYFTQIHVNAFVNRLNGEQKQQYVRARLMKDATSFLNEIPDAPKSSSGMVQSEIVDSDPTNNVIESFERRMTERKARAAKNAEEKELNKGIDPNNEDNDTDSGN